MKPDIRKIENRTPRIAGEDELFKAAVCISLIENKEDFDLLFEVRSSSLPDQPGDVCFPGGAVEPGETYKQAAIRETCEELLLLPEQVEIIGPSDIIHSRSAIIYPFAALLKDYTGTFHAGEVSEVFRVPLRFFMETEPDRYKVDAKILPADDFPYELISGGRNYKWRSRQSEELFYQYDGHVIWGLTARMIYTFCQLL